MAIFVLSLIQLFMENQVFYSKIGGFYIASLLFVGFVLGYLLIIDFSWLALVLDVLFVGILVLMGIRMQNSS